MNSIKAFELVIKVFDNDKERLDPIGKIGPITRAYFKFELKVEDQRANYVDDYNVRIRDYFRIDLKLVNLASRIWIPKATKEKEDGNRWHPSCNAQKIYYIDIFNEYPSDVEVEDMDTSERNVVKWTQERISKPYPMDHIQ